MAVINNFPIETKKRLLLASILGFLWGSAVGVFFWVGLLNAVEEKIIRLEELLPTPQKANQFVLIEIDRIPVDRPWPWPRLEYSLFLRSLIPLTPQSVVMDILFTERGPRLDSFDETFRSLINRLNRVCFAGAALKTETLAHQQIFFEKFLVRGDPRFLPKYGSAFWPSTDLTEGNPVGINNLGVGTNRGLRSVPLFFQLNENFVPSLSLVAATAKMDASIKKSEARLNKAFLLRNDNGQILRRIPLDAEGRMQLRFKHSRSGVIHIKYDDFLLYADQLARGIKPAFDLQLIHGKQVWLGLTDPAFTNWLDTDIGKMSPVEIRLEATRQIVQGDFLRRIPKGAAFAFLFLLAILAPRLFVRFSLLKAFLFFFILLGTILCLSVGGFILYNLVFPVASFFLLSVGIILCGLSARYWKFHVIILKSPHLERMEAVLERIEKKLLHDGTNKPD
ncbi:CHASE2 domain-containing protein [Methylacidiphilum caldifontis]|uniref:Stand-alone CHASE2 sensor domain protein n=1 Tax=Methylacidiphilum caldifontis TaxID=2795386 RepID=A0A4Y8PE15_9BACT|nr:CHASE2 domain-containing protein [Methylacidiphilum caldifontis]TFE69551.1 Stand-alone CHASE2 sensor domain protein [Methylacidiphilum caldifontis]